MSNRTETPATKPTMPQCLVASGSRIYQGDSMGRQEIAVATKADPHWRHHAESIASELVRRWNAHAALVAACRAYHAACRDADSALDCALPDDATDIGAALAKALRGIDAAHIALRSALALAEGGAA